MMKRLIYMLMLGLIMASCRNEIRNMDDPALSNPEPNKVEADTAITDTSMMMTDTIR